MKFCLISQRTLPTKANDVLSTNPNFNHYCDSWKLKATFLLPKKFNFNLFQPKTPHQHS